MRVLIKLGGTLLDSSETQRKLAAEIHDLVRSGTQAVVVHGGGKQMTRFLAERHDLAPRLRGKVLQAADGLFQAAAIIERGKSDVANPK